MSLVQLCFNFARNYFDVICLSPLEKFGLQGLQSLQTKILQIKWRQGKDCTGLLTDEAQKFLNWNFSFRLAD